MKSVIFPSSWFTGSSTSPRPFIAEYACSQEVMSSRSNSRSSSLKYDSYFAKAGSAWKEQTTQGWSCSLKVSEPSTSDPVFRIHLSCISQYPFHSFEQVSGDVVWL